jgi:hypothetical protein
MGFFVLEQNRNADARGAIYRAPSNLFRKSRNSVPVFPIYLSEHHSAALVYSAARLGF